MPELKVYPGKDLRKRKADFDQFKTDLELLLDKFIPQLLADWMGKDKGNFSKKINGNGPITSRFLVEFYLKLGPIVNRIRKGDPAYQIQIDMTNAQVTQPDRDYEKLWVAIRKVNQRLDGHDTEIAILKDQIKKS